MNNEQTTTATQVESTQAESTGDGVTQTLTKILHDKMNNKEKVVFTSGLMSLILKYCDIHAVKIQAVWRGYQARNEEDEGRCEDCHEKKYLMYGRCEDCHEEACRDDLCMMYGRCDDSQEEEEEEEEEEEGVQGEEEYCFTNYFKCVSCDMDTISATPCEDGYRCHVCIMRY